MTRRGWTAVVLTAGLAAGVVAAGCGDGGHAAAPAAGAAAPVVVRTAVVAEQSVAGLTELGGTVAARTSAAVAARVVAQVREVRVRAGDRVQAGQVLVVLDGADLAAGSRSASAAAGAAVEGVQAAEAERRAAEAALTLARSSHGRVQALEGRKSATRQELDEAVAALAAAESRLQAADARVAQAKQGAQAAGAAAEAALVVTGFATLTAPFAGVVTERLVEPGVLAMPGVPLVRLDGGNGFRVHVRVDEARVAALAPGTSVDVVVDHVAPATPLPGRVEEVARAVDVDARAFLVKVGVPAAAGLTSGQFARVRVPGASQPALVLPEGALVRRGQVTSVFVVENGVARVRLVEARGNVVAAGLAAGDRVVVAPPAGLVDGQAVQAGERR
ncbi:MAG: efflux RND transporter periplasmic adaptor subunit [Vicinamibacterales bacterium]